uniref:Uncharacterized protein n=1 Tax=Arundo donax TaxID=35708 RepID=A0A0A9F5C5_ARUDO
MGLLPHLVIRNMLMPLTECRRFSSATSFGEFQSSVSKQKFN